MSEDLRKLAFDQGDIAAITTEAAMMDRIKSLAVAVLHAAVHTVTLHEAVQGPTESVKTFAARVQGIAANCFFEIQCSADGCTQMVNYSEATVYHVVLAGLQDRELQSRCTAQALLGHITDIATLVAYCTAEESSKLSQSSAVAGIKKSSYRKQKTNTQSGNSGGGNSNKNCFHCGATHSGYSPAVRAKECKAFNADCSNCGKTGHFAKCCKKDKKPTAKVQEVADDQQQDSNINSNNAIEFTFFALKTKNRFMDLKDGDSGDISAPVHKSNKYYGNKGWRRYPAPS